MRQVDGITRRKRWDEPTITVLPTFLLNDKEYWYFYNVSRETLRKQYPNVKEGK